MLAVPRQEEVTAIEGRERQVERVSERLASGRECPSGELVDDGAAGHELEGRGRIGPPVAGPVATRTTSGAGLVSK